MYTGTPCVVEGLIFSKNIIKLIWHLYHSLFPPLQYRNCHVVVQYRNTEAGSSFRWFILKFKARVRTKQTTKKELRSAELGYCFVEEIRPNQKLPAAWDRDSFPLVTPSLADGLGVLVARQSNEPFPAGVGPDGWPVLSVYPGPNPCPGRRAWFEEPVLICCRAVAGVAVELRLLFLQNCEQWGLRRFSSRWSCCVHWGGSFFCHVVVQHRKTDAGSSFKVIYFKAQWHNKKKPHEPNSAPCQTNNNNKKLRSAESSYCLIGEIRSNHTEKNAARIWPDREVYQALWREWERERYIEA